MLYRKQPIILFSLTIVLASLTACANSPSAKDLEKSLAADQRLLNSPVASATPTTNPTPQLPEDFPTDIPVYPNAQLQATTPGTENQTSATWLSSDPSNFITSFYRSEFQKNNWQILQQPTDDIGTFEVKNNNSTVKVSIQPKSITNPTANQPQISTELVIEYGAGVTATTSTPETTPSPTSSETPSPNPTEVPKTGDVNQNPPVNTPTLQPQQYTDINQAPKELQRYIQELATLGVIPAYSIQTNKLEPNKIITRGEYARWLVTVNNTFYASNPSKQIRLGNESSQPAYSDVAKNNPNFPYIQGLAEAGLIPSQLSGDSTEVLFRAGSPLTREQMLLWKLPLDSRQGLPTANLEAVKQTWGFQDAAKIEPKALKAVLADHQSGEQSNIRRVFGYTTLFQPKKPVTRSEAAAVLWYFGTQGEGVSASDILKGKGRG
ncbi:S-layer homology domain-containing protein [Calothrix sp. PCC 6303]|uniref:S-layer homology domain-containing protein n=1 Tax=Calothrix sp. PCC 6303 TaxID=1170562 RepID=UPI0002A02A5A|nr:S-layer homology domain-containing protein [Calothrix sp. PCC 6303]AFZ02144.1 S-layer domain-containing protein [Calothrix sp. PCC 6303]